MPHSGGGGSHSGGFSGGGSSFSSGGSGSSSYTPSYTRGQRTYYPGSHRYVYYYNREPRYYYSTSKLTNMDYKGKWFICFAVGFFWALLWIGIVAMMVERVPSGPLRMGDIDRTIYIIDNAGVIDNSDKQVLKRELENFRDKTGIILSIVTYPEHQMGYNMETEAYNEYVRMFTDEQHWLIYYVGTEMDRSDDWEWHLMCGDDCVRILNSNDEYKFSSSLHANFVRDISFADAVIRSVDAIEPNLDGGLVYKQGVTVNDMPAGGEPVSPVFLFIFPTIGLAGVILAIISLVMIIKPVPKEHKAKMNAYNMDKAGTKIIKCEYCSGNVVTGTAVNCPYCGAALPLVNKM